MVGTQAVDRIDEDVGGALSVGLPADVQVRDEHAGRLAVDAQPQIERLSLLSAEIEVA